MGFFQCVIILQMAVFAFSGRQRPTRNRQKNTNYSIQKTTRPTQYYVERQGIIQIIDKTPEKTDREIGAGYLDQNGGGRTQTAVFCTKKYVPQTSTFEGHIRLFVNQHQLATMILPLSGFKHLPSESKS